MYGPKKNITIFKRKFFKDVAKVLTGSLAARIIGFLLMPVIARIYTPDKFGVMTVYSAIIITIGVVAGGCYEHAIVLPKKDHDAWAVFVSSLAICTILSLLCTIAVIILYRPICNFFFNADSFIWVLFLPLGIFFYCFCSILNYWTIRKKRFTSYSISQVLQTFGNHGVRLISGLIFGNKIFGLIGGTICRSVFPSIFIGIQISRMDLPHLNLIPSKKQIYSVLKKYRNFPLFSTWTAFLVNISRDIPIFFLAYLFNNDVVGAFGLANNALRIPIKFIGDSVRKVYLQKAASLVSKQKKVSSSLVKATFGLSIVSILPFGALFIWGEEIFEIIFSEKWNIAGKYVEVLSPWLFSMCINPPSTVIYTVLQKQKTFLYYTTIVTISRASVFIWGMIVHSKALSILTWLSLISTGLNIWAIIYAYKLAVGYERNYRIN